MFCRHLKKRQKSVHRHPQTFDRLIIADLFPITEQFFCQPFGVFAVTCRIYCPQSENCFRMRQRHFGNLFRIFRQRQYVTSKVALWFVSKLSVMPPKIPNRPRQSRFAGSFKPLFFKSVIASYQLSADSRKPSVSVKRCFFPVISTPIITNRHRFSSAIPAFRYIPSAHSEGDF